MTRPLIKICGITSPADAHDAVTAGADLLGLNFCLSSPRAVDLHAAKVISAAGRRAGGRRKVEIVAVFVDADQDLVNAVLEQVAPDVLQFHGSEGVDTCQSYGHPFMKAHRLRSVEDARQITQFLGGHARGYLIDTYVPGQAGGTGRLLSDRLMEAGLAHKGGFLAGGLTPANVGALVARHSPYGVDVASGVEARQRVKSRARMAAFVAEVMKAARG